MCCIVLASETESGLWPSLRPSPDRDRVWIVIESGSYPWLSESGPWLSLDRDWVWFVIVVETGPWLSLDRNYYVADWAWFVIVADCAWILKDRSQLLDDWGWLVVQSSRWLTFATNFRESEFGGGHSDFWFVGDVLPRVLLWTSRWHFYFSFVYLCDRVCVHKTLHCVRVACTSEITLRTLLYVNCITYWVLGDVV